VPAVPRVVQGSIRSAWAASATRSAFAVLASSVRFSENLNIWDLNIWDSFLVVRFKNWG
jgi:hypothetical protein